MTSRGLLLNELEHVLRNCRNIIELIEPDDLGFRPAANMRTLEELVNHLAQIPAIDLLIMRGAEEAEVQDREKKMFARSRDDLFKNMERGSRDMTRFMEGLTFDEFENGNGVAFYGRSQTYQQWLLETVTHIYHHRAQLHMYLKIKGYPVDTNTLYN
ncbi:DinB family protein [bacterium]|nr:DinB family protein [bacterium]